MSLPLLTQSHTHSTMYVHISGMSNTVTTADVKYAPQIPKLYFKGFHFCELWTLIFYEHSGKNSLLHLCQNIALE